MDHDPEHRGSHGTLGPMTQARNPTYYAGDLRRDLLDAAVRSVLRDGPSALSLRALAREVGVSHAAPRSHFADKAALFTAIAIEGFHTLGIALHAAMTATPDPVAGLHRAGAAYVRHAVQHPAHFRIMWRNDLLDDDDPVLEAAGQQAFDALVAGAERAQATGWGAGFTSRDLAAVAWSTVHGLAQLWLDGPLEVMDGRPVDDLTHVVTGALMEAFGRPAAPGGPRGQQRSSPSSAAPHGPSTDAPGPGRRGCRAAWCGGPRCRSISFVTRMTSTPAARSSSSRTRSAWMSRCSTPCGGPRCRTPAPPARHAGAGIPRTVARSLRLPPRVAQGKRHPGPAARGNDDLRLRLGARAALDSATRPERAPH